MKYIVALFLVLSIQSIQGQNKTKIDSLSKVYQSVKEDTTQILLLINIAEEYRKAKNDTSIHIATKSLAKSKNINYQKGQVKSLNIIARTHFRNKNYDEAEKYFQQSLEIDKILNNTAGIAANSYNLGLCYYYRFKYSSAVPYFETSTKSYGIINRKKGMVKSYYFAGLSYGALDKPLIALKQFLESEKMAKKTNNKFWFARCLNEIGNIYFGQKNYDLALEYYQRALVIQKERKDKKQIGLIFNNMSNVYISQKNYDLSLEYYQKSLKIKEERNDKRGMALTLYNIGFVYRKQKKYDLALEVDKKCLAIGDSLNNKKLQLYGFYGLSKTLKIQKKYDESINNALKGLEIAKEIKSLRRIKTISQDLYDSYKKKEDFTNALKYLELHKESNDSLFNVNKSKAIADLASKAEVERKEKEIAILNKNQELLEKDNELQQIETERQRNAKLALEKQAEAERLLALARQEKDKRKQDSLQSLAQKTQLEADKLKAHEKQLEAESKARKLEAIKEREAKEFQQYINYLVIVGLLSLVIFAFFIYRSRQKERKAKNQIQYQKEELQHQKEELQVMNEELHQQAEEILVQRDYIDEQNTHLEKVNKMFTNNIKVARTIQNAVLPYEDKFQIFFQEYFILNKPRDIVSGDFYWLEKVEKQIFWIVADATGHGVSGGFMSMIGTMLLDRIILNRQVFEPEQILENLHQEIRKSLKQDTSHNQSGMDLSLVRITPQKEAFEVCFAGAKNDLLYFDAQTQNIKEVKASRKSIGGNQNEEKIFKKHEILLNKDSILYLGSDGLEDQNNFNRKKFGRDNFIKLITENIKENLSIQSQKLEESLERHMKDTEQRDDILWLGVKL